jgi:hypothetical protein
MVANTYFDGNSIIGRTRQPLRSAARCAWAAALNIARFSFFNTVIHDAI